jgi:tetratricopeptide (TPR) repeat protein
MTDQIEDAAARFFDQGVSRMNAVPPDLPSAVIFFSRALFLCPNSPALHAHHGESLLRLCDFSAALLAFRKAHILSPNDESIRIRLSQLHYISGRLLFENGESECAASSFTMALELNPKYLDAWLLRIKSWIRGKFYGRALHELNTFIHQSDNDREIEQQKTEELLLQIQQQENIQQQTTKKEEEHKRTTDSETGILPSESHDESSPDRALPSNLDSASSEPALLRSATNAATARANASELSLWRTVQALILRAKLHILLERSDLALRDAGWAQSLDPRNKEVHALLTALAHKAEALYGNATAHVLAGEPAAALTALTRALELNPNDIKCYSMRASLLRADKKFDEALRDLKQALQITVAMRHARLQAQETSLHNTSLDKSQQSHPQDPQEQLAGGRTFLSEVTLTEDIGVIDEEKDSQQIELEKSLALTFNGLGVEYFEQYEYSHAISCFSKAIELDSKITAFFSNRADCYLRVGQEEQSLSDLHQSLSLSSPKDNTHSIRSRIGAIYASRGRELFNKISYEAAAAEFSRAIGIDPLSSVHYMSRARTFYALHRYESAYYDVSEAVRIRPNDHEARAFLLTLRQSLLRPADLARAPELPPIPPIDTPWNAHTALRTLHIQQKKDIEKRNRQEYQLKRYSKNMSMPLTSSSYNSNGAPLQSSSSISGSGGGRVIYGNNTGLMSGMQQTAPASGIFVKQKRRK